MGCQVQVSKHLGVYCSSKCSKVIVALGALHMVASLAFSLVARLYLQAYYVSAHVAGISTFIGLFVLSHHLFRMHTVLNCSIKAYMHVKVIWSIWCLLCCLATAVAFTWLVTVGNLNFDYLSAMVFAWMDSILMMYLVLMSLAGACDSIESTQYDFTYGDKAIDVYTVGYESKSQKGSVGTYETSTSAKCCRCCCAVIFGLIYLIFHILFAVFIFLTAFHPATTLYNVINVQKSSDMYTVEVDGHRPLALFLRCRGNGSETIIFENGLGGLAMMQWDFIPKQLEDKYKVCVHDRRGYGWSEGFEWDHITSEQQWAENNAQFFQALVKKAGIQTPFYYVGHSYGGIHLAYNAYKYPDTIKGLVFLDSARFSPVATLRSLMEVINNFKGLGLVEVALGTGLLDYRSAFGEVVNFDHISADTRDQLLASIATGYYFSAFHSETQILMKDVTVQTSYGEHVMNYPAAQLHKLMAGNTIDTPVLVIDADQPGSFSGDKFSKYNSSDYHYAVPGADHQTLVYDFPYAATVSGLIDMFIQLDAGQIDRENFVSFARNETMRAHGVNDGTVNH